MHSSSGPRRFMLILCGIACAITLWQIIGPSFNEAVLKWDISRDLKSQGYTVKEIKNAQKTEADAYVQVRVQDMSCVFVMHALKDGKRWNAYTDRSRSFPPVSNDELTNQLTKQANHEPVPLIMFPVEDCRKVA